MTCCCTNWKILLSDSEIEKYEKMEHPFRDNILNAINKDKKCMKGYDGNCQLLTNDGWCQIVQNCGEEYLFATCKQFPRERKCFGDVLEQTLGIACPVVAGYLMETDPIEFCFDEVEGVQQEVESMDYEIYDALSMCRAYLVELLQSYDNYFSTGKMYIVLSLMYKIKELIQQNKSTKENILEKLKLYDNQEFRVTVFEKGEEISRGYKSKAGVIQKLSVKIEGTFEFLQKAGFVRDEKLKKHIETWKTDIEDLTVSIEKFSMYYRENYSTIFQNYFVYVLFGGWVTAEVEKFGEEFVSKMIEFTMIQLWAMSIWKTKGKIDREEYINIIASCARGVNHNGRVKETIMKFLDVNQMNNVSSLLMFLIV